MCAPAPDTPAEIAVKNMSQLRNLFVWILLTDFKIISMYVTKKSLFTIILIHFIFLVDINTTNLTQNVYVNTNVANRVFT